MNSTLRTIIIFVLGVFISAPLFGATGCMARSKHAYLCNDGADVCGDQCDCLRVYYIKGQTCYTGQPVCCKPIDYKTLHYVYCSCPCGSGPRYQILGRKGKCLECWHYHDPADYDLFIDN